MDRRRLNSGGGWAALFFVMATYTYQSGANPPIDYPRLLIPDTNSAAWIFSDEEIAAFTIIQSLQFQCGQRYTFPAGANLPTSPVSYLRIAALAIDAIANNSARLAIFTKVLDVTMAPGEAAKLLGARADSLRKTDDESGAFAIIEQVRTQADFQTRWWNQIQRQFA